MTVMVCNAAGIKLIQSFESCRLNAYLDQRDIPTIGWGATGSDIVIPMSWSQQQCDERFADDLLTKAETPLNRLIHPEITLTNNQFSALCSLCYNIGSGNMASSSALSMINLGALDEVPNHISLWDEVNGIANKGLIRRRNAEIALWSTPD